MNRIRTTILLLPFCAPVLAPAQSVNFSFETLNGNYCTPARVQFNSMAGGTPQGYVWVFGNLGSSNLNQPVFIFNEPGTYPVKMIAIYKKQAISITKNITIHPGVNPGFDISRKNLCTPGMVLFTINEGEGNNYIWDFGDGSSPVTANSTSIIHQFTQFGDFNIKLKAQAYTGCQGETANQVFIQRPQITGSATPLTGCTPALANFHAQIVVPQGSVINGYSWSFGDGQTSNTATPNTTHNFLQPGSFQPSLNVTTMDGCSNHFQFANLAFGIPPVNLTAYPTLSTFCGSESPAFVAKATNANRYFWDFGNQDTLSVSDTVIYHKFKHTGLQSVTVTPYFNDCAGTPATFQVNVIGVISRFGYQNTCSDKKAFHFTNNSQGNQSAIFWNIINSPLYQNQNEINYSFPQVGSFPVSLLVEDSITGCSDVSAVTIYTANPILMNPDRAICKGAITNFEVINNYVNPRLTYEWQVIGLNSGPGSFANPYEVIASIHGNFYNNRVIINNGIHYCQDTVSMAEGIIVRGPVLDFTAPSQFCANLPCVVTNQSASYLSTDAIISWKWSFNLPIDAARDTTFNPHPFIYQPYFGHYNISLKAKDINGCTDSLNKPIVVYKVPFLKKIPDVDTLCAGQQATVIAFHSEPVLWTSAATLPCTTCDTLNLHPLQTTNYIASSVNQWNCESRDSIQIVVYEPFTASANQHQFSICRGDTIALHISPLNKVITWEPAQEVPGGGFNPIIKPAHSETLIATLKDSAGCFSSRAIINAHVKPLPTIEAGPNRAVTYNSEISLSPLYSTNVAGFLWSPATNLNCTTCAAPVSHVTQSENYTITVISDSGCIARDKISIIVKCVNANLLVPTAFTPNRDGLNDFMRPVTRGVKKITNFTIYNREGVLMYEAKEKLPNEKSWGWDGTYRGAKQPPASYVYVLQSVCDAGETITSKGSFLLLR